MDKAIITECYVDSNLLETLVPTTTGYNKQHGCSNVVKLMQGRLRDSFAVGIVDKDKRELDYLKQFVKVDEVDGRLFLWRHAENKLHHYIIQISPEVEPWLLRIAGELGLKMEDYKLPNGLTDLYDYAKQRSSKNDPNFRNLFSDFTKADHIVVNKLKFWITYLKQKNYKADIKELRNV